MDLFIYGCPRIIRYLSNMNHNCIIYDIESILKELDIDMNNFKLICIMCGTDYNKKINNIYINYNLFLEFKNNKNNNITFKNYIINQCKISNLNFKNIIKLLKIKNNDARKSAIFPEE